VHSARDLILSYVEPIKIVVMLVVNSSGDFDKFQLSYCVPHTTSHRARSKLWRLDHSKRCVDATHVIFGGEEGAEGEKVTTNGVNAAPCVFMHLIRLEHEACQLSNFKLQAILRAWHVLPLCLPRPSASRKV
jgi:hypothetical protein